MTSIQQWRETARDLERLDCDVLLAHALSCNRADILAHPERALGAATLYRLNTWRERRIGGEPLAYILQTKEFWGLDFAVTPDVLIPRPETELLVEHALGVVRTGDRLLELGTGCGAPAIAICNSLSSTKTAEHEHPIEVTASDISQAALDVARHNATRHGVAVTWVHSDWFSHICGLFDVIVSNPPYVANNDPHLTALTDEPRLALVAGHNGLDAITHIVATAQDYLAPGGWLLLEHGYQQGHLVRQMFRDAGYLQPRSERDLGGHARITLGRRPQ